jgi:hypothetical protein
MAPPDGTRHKDRRVHWRIPPAFCTTQAEAHSRISSFVGAFNGIAPVEPNTNWNSGQSTTWPSGRENRLLSAQRRDPFAIKRPCLLQPVSCSQASPRC